MQNTLPANGQAQTLPGNPGQPYEIGKRYTLKWTYDNDHIMHEAEAFYRHGFNGLWFYFTDGSRLSDASMLLSVTLMPEAQPLPAKWVILVTPYNVHDLYRWANKQFNRGDDLLVGDYIDSHGTIYNGRDNTYDSLTYTLITDSQFKAMVEGCPDSGQPSDAEIERKHNLVSAHKYLTWAGEYEAAAALKSKHPEIWPVDYAAIVLEKAVAWYEANKDQYERLGGFNEVSSAVMEAVRNYLTNQK